MTAAFATTEYAPVQISDAGKAFYKKQGYTVVRNLLPTGDLEILRRRADDIVSRRIRFPENEVLWGRRTGVFRRSGGHSSGARGQAETLPEVRLSDRFARRGEQIYPLRRRPIDQEALAKALATGDPYNEVTNINSVADHDEVFATYAGHPRIVSVLQQLLAPNAKLFFDNLYNKGPYFDANRFHQDGFFMFSKGAITLWIALDDVTLDNGCFYYIPLTASYGRFSFDNLGRADGGITLEQLEQAVPIELKAGDAAVHDRWTIHATGPNETPNRRRGWSVFYTDAESQFVRDPVFKFERYVQTPEGEHWRDDQVYGNRYYRLVCGREFPGGV